MRFPLFFRAAALGIFFAALLLGRPVLGENHAFTTFAGAPGNVGYIDGVGSAARFHVPSASRWMRVAIVSSPAIERVEDSPLEAHMARVRSAIGSGVKLAPFEQFPKSADPIVSE